MTDLLTPEPRSPGHRATRKEKSRRSPLGCLVIVVVLALIGGLGYVGVQRGADWLQDALGPPEDYSGPGSGSVVVEVADGDTAAAIGRTLKDAGVVASVDAYIEASAANPESGTIQPGFYELRSEMASDDAVRFLLDTSNRTGGEVIVVPGTRKDQVAQAIIDGTEMEPRQVRRVIESGEGVDLPRWAEGDVEGFLWPATYVVGPDDTPRDLVSDMVAGAVQFYDEVGLQERARELGLDRLEAITVASIVEREVSRDGDRPKAARVIYNRLDDGMKLQMDSTVHYVSEREGDAFTTDDERDIDSPYNTYMYEGLPPGPIDSPSAEAVEATLAPADGDWIYFVAVNFDTGETKFAETADEHAENVEELQAWCADEGSDICG